MLSYYLREGILGQEAAMSPMWLTAAELADRLRVQPATLWQWKLRRYGPPAVRVGGKLRYKLKAVEAWEREQETLARAE
jgi:Helix-turn-helix domain